MAGFEVITEVFTTIYAKRDLKFGNAERAITNLANRVAQAPQVDASTLELIEECDIAVATASTESVSSASAL